MDNQVAPRTVKIKLLSNPLLKALREICAIVFWIYVVTKLFVFDVDIYLVNQFAPKFYWIFSYKLIILLVSSTIAWILLGKSQFPTIVLYILAYPIVVFCWKLPILLFRNWPIAIAFSPAVYELVITFRTSFIFWTLAAFSSVLICSSHNVYIVIPCMILIGLFLIRHLFRSFKTAYKSSMFAGLAKMIQRLRSKIESGFIVDELWKKVDLEKKTAETDKAFHEQLTSFYLFNFAFEYLEERLNQFAKSRKPDLYFIASWLWTLLITAVIFAFEYFGLFIMDPRAFKGDSDFSFWSFLGFSFGKLTPSSISQILPVSRPAHIVCYFELGCAILIVVLLFFILLTAARERYREDINDFTVALRETAQVLQKKYLALYALAIPEVEKILLTRSAEMINKLRKFRGLPELIPPKV